MLRMTKVRDASVGNVVIPAPDSSIGGQASAGIHL
jgi:hypothetical protein